MSVTLSPTVNTRVKDFSTFVTDTSATIVGCVGGAQKGPVDEALLCTSPQDFLRKFGEPIADSMSTYGALQFLQEGNQLFYVRVADGDETASSLTVDNGAETDEEDVLEISALTPGTWGDRIEISITDIENGDSTDSDTVFTVEVYYDESLEESFTECVLNEESDEGTYVEDAVNEDTSNFIEIEDVRDGSVTEAGEDSEIDDDVDMESLSDGENGLDDLSDSEIIGSSDREGLQIFRNTERIDINVLIVPGRSAEDAVIAEMLDIAESRGDTLAIIDAPDNLTAQEVVEWHNGEGEGDKDPASAVNSEYGALYYPWMEIHDAINETDVWIPPSGMIAGTFARTDRENGRWYAPAGLKRGRLIRALDLRFSPSKGERDLMYGGGDAVNPIVNFSNEGITVWGQRTLLRQNSAKNRVNVMRLLLMVRKAIAGSTRYLVFDLNDSFLWNEWKGMVRPYLEGLKNARALYDFEVEMGETTMTTQDVDENKLNGRIELQPTKTAEFITIDFVLTRTEAVFE